MNIWEIDKVFLFIVIVLPGFISIKVYDLIIAGDKRDFSKSLIEAIAYSVLNFTVLSWLILIVSKVDFSKNHEFLYYLSIIFIFIIVPSIWPFLFIWLSKLKIFKQHLLTPINQPWDKVFNRREALWIIINLKNGKTIRGKYSLKSSASAYPKERQIYLEELWEKGENGGFKEKVSRTRGIIVFESEISSVEFYE